MASLVLYIMIVIWFLVIYGKAAGSDDERRGDRLQASSFY